MQRESANVMAVFGQRLHFLRRRREIRRGGDAASVLELERVVNKQQLEMRNVERRTPPRPQPPPPRVS